MLEADGKRDLVHAARRRPGDNPSFTKNIHPILFLNPLQSDEGFAKKGLNVTGFDCRSNSGSAGTSFTLRRIWINHGR
jgi:hypothetical protein